MTCRCRPERRHAPRRRPFPRRALAARRPRHAQSSPRPPHLRHHLAPRRRQDHADRSEEHTSELQSLMRISYAVFCLKKKNNKSNNKIKRKQEHNIIKEQNKHRYDKKRKTLHTEKRIK